MSLEPATRLAFARRVGLLTRDGMPSRRGVADLLRSALSRWRLAPRRTVLRYARQQIDAAGLREQYSPLELGGVLDQLIVLDDCQAILIGQERYVSVSLPRWLRMGRDVSVLLGATKVPHVVSIATHRAADDVVRRLRPFSEEIETALHLGGFRHLTLEEWFRPAQYMGYASRRLGRPLRDDAMPLNAFWDLLVSEMAERGQLMGEDAPVRLLAGSVNGFFGRYDSAEPEGRWAKCAADGVWCGYRRGYSDSHWQPALIEVDGNDRRSVDLFDADEWRWAVMARARAQGIDEVSTRANGQVSFTFPLPTQLSAAMDLIGVRSGAWSWSAESDAPDVWTLLR